MNVDVAEFATLDAFALTVASGDEETIGFFNNLCYEGNGYTWDGIVRTLARLKFPGRLSELSFSPEADSALVCCRDRALIQRLAAELRKACGNENEILHLIESADEGAIE